MYIAQQITPSRILVINFGRLSDVVFSLPALHALRERFPSARITLAATKAGCELVSLMPYVSDLLPADKVELRRMYLPWVAYRGFRLVEEVRRRRYDLAIDLLSSRETSLLAWFSRARFRSVGTRGRGPLDALFNLRLPVEKPHKHMVDRYLDLLKPLGVQVVEREPRLRTLSEFDRRVDGLLKSKSPGAGELFVGIHPGADYGPPFWPVENFADLGKRLFNNFNVRILVASLKGEEGAVAWLASKAPEGSITLKASAVGELVSALARCAVVISGDCGPGHIAAALGVPALIVGCPITRKPMGSEHHYIDSFGSRTVSTDHVFDIACEMLRRSRTSALFQR